ncbi:glycine cleavage system aminomethyltransferase GcvT, partial [Pseudomonas aeruginosa]|nr:glycine cleavage system aminomethyltransferase GcvT [Pseudomonas aeruginosa]
PYRRQRQMCIRDRVTAMVRGKPVTLVVSKMPFVAQRYYRG